MERCLRPIALRRPDSGPPDFDAEITGLGATGLGCAATAGLEGAGTARLRMLAACADINGGSSALNTSLLHPETDPAARTVLADGIRGGSSSTTCACVCALNALESLIIDCIWTEFFEEP